MYLRAAIAFFSAAVTLITHTAAANEENMTEMVPKGFDPTYGSPYMGFIYYDESSTNNSFFRAAILITPQYLVSASIDVANEAVGFPRRTLLVRVGAPNLRSISTASNDSSSDEEDIPRDTEQEHEVIQIIRPYKHLAEKRWLSDIAVIKVLKPFTMTPYVNVTRLGTAPRLHTDKLCNILVYLKSEDHSVRTLQKITVKVLSHSACADRVPNLFNKDHIICAIEQEHQHILSKDATFCERNAGSPLVCEEEVVALLSNQHDSKCEPPYVFHRLHIWEEFIKCSVDGKCGDKSCENICVVTYKDKPETTTEELTRRAENLIDDNSVVDTNATEKFNKTGSVGSAIFTGNSTMRQFPNKVSNSTVLLRYKSSSTTLNAKVSVSLIMWNIFFKLFT